MTMRKIKTSKDYNNKINLSLYKNCGYTRCLTFLGLVEIKVTPSVHCHLFSYIVTKRLLEEEGPVFDICLET